MRRTGNILLGAAALAFGAGCGPSRKFVSDHDRVEAAHLVSEAQFAITIRDWPRAEGLLTKAVQIAPDGDFWLTLGSTRVRQGNRAGARKAYEAALKEYQDAAARDSTQSDPWLKQAYVLAFLGRTSDSRSVLAKAAKRFPNDERVRSLTDPKQFERMLSLPTFKEMAL